MILKKEEDVMKNMKSSNKHYANLIKKSPALRAAIEDAQLSVDISMQIAKLRQDAGLTQEQLADLSRIQQSNISRLESPGYQGYTLKVLAKVVRALGAKLRVEIVPATITTTNRHTFFSTNRHISSLKPPTTRAASSEGFATNIKEVIHV